MNYPKVSVITITYGHEKYITETLDGVLMQQYDGPVEFIIANDNSPDKTDEAVKKYFAEHAVPDNFEIKYTRHEINKGMNHNFIWAAQRATGKYIAMCEGDDYWTDPLKLQKQVNILEKNAAYNFVVSDFSILGEQKVIDERWQKRFNKADFLIQFKDFFELSWMYKTLTLVFRNKLDYDYMRNFTLLRDVHLIYFLLKSNGEGYYLNEKMGMYRKHAGGVHSGLGGNNKQSKVNYEIWKEFYKYEKTAAVKTKFVDFIIDEIYYNRKYHWKEIFKYLLNPQGMLRAVIASIESIQDKNTRIGS